MQKEWCAIINPKSGSGKGLITFNERFIANLAENNIKVTELFTESVGHAIELTKKAIKDGHRNLIAVGGDGTINEVVNGIFQQKEVPVKELRFTAIASGTGSDWARTHNISAKEKEVVAMLLNERTIQHDIGMVAYSESEEGGERLQRYFINVAGMAYDSMVAERTLDVPKNGMSGKFFYLMGALNSLRDYKPLVFKIESADGLYFEDDVMIVNIGICPFSGGGMSMVPLAKYDDGLLDLTIVRSMSRMSVINNIKKLYNGKIYDLSQASHHQTKKITITSKPNSRVEVEGELLGWGPFEFDIIPAALQVVIPA